MNGNIFRISFSFVPRSLPHCYTTGHISCPPPTGKPHSTLRTIVGRVCGRQSHNKVKRIHGAKKLLEAAEEAPFDNKSLPLLYKYYISVWDGMNDWTTGLGMPEDDHLHKSRSIRERALVRDSKLCNYSSRNRKLNYIWFAFIWRNPPSVVVVVAVAQARSWAASPNKRRKSDIVWQRRKKCGDAESFMCQCGGLRTEY